MQTARTCPRCRTPYSGAHCPRCVLEAALGRGPAGAPEPEAEACSDSGPLRAEPLDFATVERAFPDFDGFELLGRGGMGVVYKARQKKLERTVALKLLPREFGRDAKLRERFLREARALARLVHPNIVAVHDFGESDGLCFLVLEYVDGTNLRDVLKKGPLAPREALAVVRALCDALQYAHDEGVVHRDIKPENVLLDRAGHVKVADFGLAKVTGTGAGANLTAVDQVMGTPHYMAPEQMEHPRDVDHRADLFALGVVMYEMLTGALPRGAFELPSQRLHVDVRLDEVVLKALERDPARRYQHAIEVKTDVEDIEARPLARPTVRREAPSASARTPDVRRKGDVRGWRALAVCTATWIVVGVAWNLGAFALGMALVMLAGMVAFLMREHLSAHPDLTADLAAQAPGARFARRIGALALTFVAGAALLVFHVAHWEHGVATWSPSFQSVTAFEADVLTEPQRLESGSGGVPGSNAGWTIRLGETRTGLGVAGTLGLLRWPLFALGAVALFLAVRWALRPTSQSLRDAVWDVAGRVGSCVLGGLVVCWIAGSIAALRQRVDLHELSMHATSTAQFETMLEKVHEVLAEQGLTIDYERELSSTRLIGDSVARGALLRAQAKSPFDRWSVSLAGPRRETPQMWIQVVGPTRLGRGWIRIRGGLYDPTREDSGIASRPLTALAVAFMEK